MGSLSPYSFVKHIYISRKGMFDGSEIEFSFE